MPTLGISAEVTLSTAETRSSLEKFYRGIKVDSVSLRPFKTLENDSDVYDTSETNAIIFVSDEYNGTNPFDLTLISSEIDEVTQTNKSLTLQAVGICILDVSNIISVVVSSTGAKVGYRLLS